MCTHKGEQRKLRSPIEDLPLPPHTYTQKEKKLNLAVKFKASDLIEKLDLGPPGGQVAGRLQLADQRGKVTVVQAHAKLGHLERRRTASKR